MAYGRPPPPPSPGGATVLARCRAGAWTLEHHVFVLFPVFSVFTGVLGGELVDAALRQRPRALQAGLWVLVVAGLIAGPLSIARFFCGPPCVVSTEFKAHLEALPAGTEVDVVADEFPWTMLSALSAERQLVPFPSRSLDPTGRRWLLVGEGRWEARADLEELARARGWVLGVRKPTPVAPAVGPTTVETSAPDAGAAEP